MDKSLEKEIAKLMLTHEQQALLDLLRLNQEINLRMQNLTTVINEARDELVVASATMRALNLTIKDLIKQQQGRMSASRSSQKPRK